jgi:membrane carboxypeptidase/penicillin-binding protein PbpC
MKTVDCKNKAIEKAKFATELDKMVTGRMLKDSEQSTKRRLMRTQSVWRYFHMLSSGEKTKRSRTTFNKFALEYSTGTCGQSKGYRESEGWSDGWALVHR